MEPYKKLFHHDPTTDPVTGESIKINSKRYKELVKEYGPPKVKSPKSSYNISIGGKAYQDLLKEGHQEENLLHRHIKSPKTNKYIAIGSKPYKELSNMGYFKSITGVKEIDEAILLELDAMDLGKIMINKYIQNIIDDKFFCTWLYKHYGIEESIHCKDVAKLIIKNTHKWGIAYGALILEAANKNYLSVIKYIYKTERSDLIYNKFEVLHISVINNYIKMLEFLLLNIKYDAYDLIEALTISIKEGNIEAVKLLVNAGSKINDALVLSAEYGQLEMVEYFLTLVKDKVIITQAFLQAAINGHLEAVKYLIAYGANIHANNHHALEWSAYHGYLDVFEYLYYLEDKNHYNVNHLFKWSVWHGGFSVAKFLTTHNNISMDEINDAVIVCAVRGYEDMLIYLMNKYHQIRENTKNKALLNAAQGGYFYVVKYLLQHGAYIHYKEDKVIDEALHNNNQDIVIYLLDEGISVDTAIKYSQKYTYDNTYLYHYKETH